MDDIYNRRQKNTVDELYDGLNKYHPKVKLTIEINPLRFLDPETIHNNGMVEARVHRKKTKLPTPWNLTFLNGINGITLKQSYIEQSAFHQTLQMR